MVQTTETALTWTAFLNIINTILVAVLGFVLREAWTAIHRRMDSLEDQHGNMRERVAVVETHTGVFHRRRTDPQPEE